MCCEVTHACANGAALLPTKKKQSSNIIFFSQKIRGFAVASFCVGGLFGGSSVWYYFKPSMAVRRTISFNNIGWVIGAVLIGVLSTLPCSLSVVIFCGSSGSWFSCYSTYVGEISTVRARGTMGTCNQFAVVIEARANLQKLSSWSDIEQEFFEQIEGILGKSAAEAVTNVKQIELQGKKEKDEFATMIWKMVLLVSTMLNIAISVLVLHMIQQLIGMNAVMYFYTTTSKMSFDAEMSKYMAIVTTVVNFVSTIASLILIDRMGRRPLLLIAEAGACIFSVLLVIGYVYALVLFCIHGYSFAIFAAIAAMAFAFTWIFVPETKNRSIESIVKSFEK
ncbi:hypothetical protein BD560DRAFT_418952 [Blakeslea trispora]|nr:hypothetical protein BD560DRAFT_418952 [Blakeslea trispora]